MTVTHSKHSINEWYDLIVNLMLTLLHSCLAGEKKLSCRTATECKILVANKLQICDVAGENRPTGAKFAIEIIHL